MQCTVVPALSAFTASVEGVNVPDPVRLETGFVVDALTRGDRFSRGPRSTHQGKQVVVMNDAVTHQQIYSAGNSGRLESQL
jgi:hypothetical protein